MGANLAFLARRLGVLATRRRCPQVLLSVVVSGAIACHSAPATKAPELAPAADRTTLGPGDLFQLEIVGEKELPKEYQVAADGTVSLPYIHVLMASGLEPHEFAKKVRDELIAQKILVDPSVVVTVKEYRSKVVTLLGQVQRPGSFPLGPGMTLLQAISLSGGFTSIAKADQVTLIRKYQGKTTTVLVNVEDIYEGRTPDIELQPGDRVFVRERIF
jgi:polysaccharide export outer membrane protein